MWDIVIRAAIKNDVQIFATTHDEDSIKGFQEAAEKIRGENSADIASAFKLQRVADDELKSYHFSINQLGYAIEQDNEVR